MINRVKRKLKEILAHSKQEVHYCKRRLENCVKGCTVHIYCDQGKENPDYWYRRDGVLVCSYCGGLKPSEVTRLINEGKVTDWESTDKYYKFYLHVLPNKQYKGYMPHYDKESWEEMISLVKSKDLMNTWRKRITPIRHDKAN